MIFRENPSEKPQPDRSYTKQPGCTACELRFYFQCVNRSGLVWYVQCAEEMRNRASRGL